MSWRGGERQIAFLMKELDQKGIRQALFCANGGKMEEWALQHGYTIYSFKKSFSLNPLTAKKLAKTSFQNNYSHIHTHDSHAHTHAIMAASLYGLKTSLIVHRRVDFPVKQNLISRFKYNHPSIKAFVCCSEFIKNILSPSIARKPIIHTVHSGIEISQTEQNVYTDIRKEFDIPDKNKIIINLAAIAPHKDYFTFVNTAEVLIKNGLKATFLLIGEDGGEFEKIKKYIDHKGFKKQLILTGYRTDVANILGQTDLMLFTSKTEGLGGATLDALKAGVPVVATNAGGVPEIIEDGKTGLIAPVGDAASLAEKVIYMLNNDDFKNEIVENGLEKIKDFSKTSTAEKTLEIYLETISLVHK